MNKEEIGRVDGEIIKEATKKKCSTCKAHVSDCKCGSEEKAYDFWLRTINENNPKFFRAGCEWMVNYWQKRLLDNE